MQKMKVSGNLPDPYGQLQIFADLSQHTLSRRRQLSTITKALRNNNIQYQWIAPAKMSITHNGSKHIVTTLQEGLHLLQRWRIIPDPPAASPMDQSNAESQQNQPLPQRSNSHHPS